MLNKKSIVILVIVLIIMAGSLFLLAQPTILDNGMNDSTSAENPVIIMKTNKGDIIIELFLKESPITAGNFLKLVNENYFDEIKLHRIISGFVIQGGDPNSKGDDTSIYGFGGPGYTIQDEFIEGFSNVRGTLSMANSGPNTGGSQFFINLADNTNLDFDKEPLTSRHPVFGRIVSGMDVVDVISKVEVDARDIPINPIIIKSMVVDNKVATE